MQQTLGPGTEGRQKRRGDEEKERDKYSNVVLHGSSSARCGGRIDAKAALFSTLWNILESWRKLAFVPLFLPLHLFPGSFSAAFLISIVVDVPPTGCIANAHDQPLLSTPPQPPFNPFGFLHAQNGDVAISPRFYLK